MLTVFFDQEGVIHHEYALKDQTVNKEYYKEVLKRLRDAVRRKRPDLWTSGDWMLHQRACPFIATCPAISCETRHCSASSASIQS